MIIILKTGDVVEVEDKYYKVIKAGRTVVDTEGCSVTYNNIDTIVDDEVSARVDSAIVDVSIVG